MAKLLESPRRTAFVGLGITLIGLFLSQAFGGVADLQAATSPDEFGAVADEIGSGVRWASWVDILVIVPGYTLLLGGLLLLLARTGPSFVPSAKVGLRLLGAGVVFDQIENAALQVGLGTVDLDQPGADEIVDPAGWLIAVLQGAYWLKWICLLSVVVIIVGLVLRRRGQRQTEANGEETQGGRMNKRDSS